MKKHRFALASVAVTALLMGCNENSSTANVEEPSAETTQQAQQPIFTIGERVTGEITSQNPVNFKDGSRYQVFNIEISSANIAEGNLFEVTLRGALNGTLSLFDGPELIASSSGYERNPKLRSLVDEGQSLQLIVHGQDANSFGPFILTSSMLNVPLALDSTILYPIPLNESSWLGDEHQELRFKVEQAGLYRIDLASEEFDTLLKLTGTGVALENDDGPDGTNSQLITFLDTGEYTLTVQSYSEGTGLYTVTVTEESLPAGIELQNSGILILGSEIHGMLVESQNTYSIEVPEDGLYEISLTSDTFDAYLELAGQGLHAEDDDGGEGTNARLEVDMTPGTYTVTAKGFSGQETGLYQLSFNRLD